MQKMIYANSQRKLKIPEGNEFTTGDADDNLTMREPMGERSPVVDHDSMAHSFNMNGVIIQDYNPNETPGNDVHNNDDEFSESGSKSDSQIYTKGNLPSPIITTKGGND